MNDKIKPGFFFGAVMSALFISQGLLAANSLSGGIVVKIIAVGIFSGALAGLFFGFLMAKFRTSKFVSDSTLIKLEKGEQIIFQTPANHFKGVEAVGGKLYVTNKRLVFKSHKLNFQKHELSILLHQITQVERSKTAKLFNNGIIIHTFQNTTERFVVEKADEWYTHLTTAAVGVAD